jgi:hypothetical protein
MQSFDFSPGYLWVRFERKVEQKSSPEKFGTPQFLQANAQQPFLTGFNLLLYSQSFSLNYRSLLVSGSMIVLSADNARYCRRCIPLRFLLC